MNRSGSRISAADISVVFWGYHLSGELTLNAANGQASIPAFGYPAFKMGTLKVSPGIDSQSIQVVGQACDVLAIGRERMR